jgi:glucose-1-phosphate cytidylyltransferase
VSNNELVTHFGEKNQASAGWINGGFFVLEREVQRFIDSDHQPFEYEPISKIVAERQLATYRHKGFWHPMDTLREKLQLDKYATENLPPWFILQ